MKAAYEIQNRGSEPLHVWIEPWCHPYCVPKDSALRLSYVATAEPLIAEFTSEALIVWINARAAPSAELDGVPIAPDFS